MNGILQYLVFAAFVLTALLLSLKSFLRKLLLQLFWISIEKFTDGKFVRAEGIPRAGDLAMEDITNPEWLTKTLRGKFPKTSVESASARSMGHDMGNASTMFRLEISYSKNPHKLPETMIIKLVKNDLKNRLPFTATRMNEMETLFYSTDLCDELREKHGLHFIHSSSSKR